MGKYKIIMRLVYRNKTVGYILKDPQGKTEYMLLDDVYKLAYNDRLVNASIQFGDLKVPKFIKVNHRSITDDYNKLIETRNIQRRKRWAHLDFEYFVAKSLCDDKYEIRRTDGEKQVLSAKELLEFVGDTPVKGVKDGKISSHWMIDEADKIKAKARILYNSQDQIGDMMKSHLSKYGIKYRCIVCFDYENYGYLEIYGLSQDFEEIKDENDALFSCQANILDLAIEDAFDVYEIQRMAVIDTSNISIMDSVHTSDPNNCDIVKYSKRYKNLQFMGNWDTRNVKYMGGLFGLGGYRGDTSFLKNWDTSNVKTLRETFCGIERLEDLSFLSNWNMGSLEVLS